MPSLLPVRFVIWCSSLTLSHRHGFLWHWCGVLRVRTWLLLALVACILWKEHIIPLLAVRPMNLGWAWPCLNLIIEILSCLFQLLSSCKLILVLLLKQDSVSIELLVGIAIVFFLHLVIDDGSMFRSVISTLIPLVLSRLLLLSLLLPIVYFLRVISLLWVEVDLLCFGVYFIVRNQLSYNLSHIFLISQSL